LNSRPADERMIFGGLLFALTYIMGEKAANQKEEQRKHLGKRNTE